MAKTSIKDEHIYIEGEDDIACRYDSLEDAKKALQKQLNES